jgi:uncharacterized protein
MVKITVAILLALLCISPATAGAQSSGKNIAAETEYEKGQAYFDRQDFPSALSWLQRASDHGSNKATHQLEWMYATNQGVKFDLNRYAALVKKAAEQGNVSDQEELGKEYELGDGRPTNYSEAFRWYTKANDGQHPFANNHLGILYWCGLGTKQDQAKARQLWAADANSPGSPAKEYLATGITCPK